MKARIWQVTFPAAAVLMLGASNCTPKAILTQDSAAQAAMAGDYTAIVEGCGNQPVPGYTYCRVHEGQSTDSKLTFYAPPSDCLAQDPATNQPWTSCASVTIYDSNGNAPKTYAIPRGQVSVSVPWKEISGHAAFTKGDRGFWPFTVQWHWIDKDGFDQTTITEGEVRLRVIALQVCPSSGSCLSYEPLNDSAQDANFAWTWSSGSTTMRATTSGRAYAGPTPLPSASPSVGVILNPVLK